MDRLKEEELFTKVLNFLWNGWQLQVSTESLSNLWNRWQLRLLVLLSFSVQATLTILGNKRKTTTSNLIKIIVWSAYMVADSVAVLALGIFSNTNQAARNVVLVLWIPLLLLHLGGPDAITAYSMEDNELWVRHLLQFVIQVVGSIYVFIKAWNTSSSVTYIALPLFVAGIIKYAERIYALKSATLEQFRIWTRDHCIFGQPEAVVINQLQMENSFARISIRDFIHTAYVFLKAAGTLLTDEPNYEMDKVCASLIERNSFGDVFLMNEIILGLLYEWFYTKMQVFFSLRGYHLRFLCISCLVSVLVVFSIINKQGFSQVDVVISYVMLVGAIFLEIFSLEVFFQSDWLLIHSIILEDKEQDVFHKWLLRTMKRISKLESKFHRKRWSGHIGRFNLLEFLSQINTARCNIPESFYKHVYKTIKPLPSDLKKLIYTELVVERRKTFSEWKQIQKRYHNEEFRWAFNGSFSDSILNWHVATDLLSVLDDDNVVEDPKRQISLVISEYMVYLIEMCPSMVLGPGRLQGSQILEQAPDGGFPKKITKQNKKEVYVELLSKCKLMDTEIREPKHFELVSAIQLANMLNARSCTIEETWEMIHQVWLDMLFYAARQCSWDVHVQYLRRGGEFLSHVWFLTLHSTLEEKVQASSPW